MDILLFRRDVGQMGVGATTAKADQSFDAIGFTRLAECVECSAVYGAACNWCVSTALVGHGLVVDAQDCVRRCASHE